MNLPGVPLLRAFQWGLIVLVSTICAPLSADTIIGRTGPAFSDFTLGPNDVFCISWSTSDAFSNVSITARMTSFSGMPGSGIAYLTTQIGPGTTVLDQVASAPFIVSAPIASDVLLFSGLSLTAGTYYLTLSSPESTTAWLGASNPPMTTAPGVSYNGQFGQRHTPVDPYPPASGFMPTDVAQGYSSLLFVVSGDAVPEPSTAVTLLVGCGLLICRQRRRGVPSVRRDGPSMIPKTTPGRLSFFSDAIFADDLASHVESNFVSIAAIRDR